VTRRQHHDGDAARLGLPDDEWNLLVDYVGGALPEGAQDSAALRVAEDPRWAAAYAALTRATESVRQDLRALGTDVGPMPDDLAGRVAAALAAAGPPPGTPAAAATTSRAAADPAPGPGGGRPAGRATTAAGPGGSRRPAGRPDGTARAGRLPRRWATSGLAAAGVLVVVLGGLGLLRSPAYDGATGAGGPVEATSADAQGSGFSAERTTPDRALAQLGARRVTHSGTDYTAGTLPAAATERVATGYGTSVPGPAAGPDDARAGTPDAALARLTAPPALAACLDAVAREHPRAAVAVELVDFARYEGAPALVVVFTDTVAARWVWVTGPACGVPGSGADTRHRLPVG